MKNRIRIFRAEFDMTQSQLAEHIGVSRQSIVAIENSKYVPSTILALKMAKLFNTDVSNIFSLEDFSRICIEEGVSTHYFIDEEGKFAQCPEFNRTATEIARKHRAIVQYDYIVGKALLCNSDMIE